MVFVDRNYYTFVKTLLVNITNNAFFVFLQVCTLRNVKVHQLFLTSFNISLEVEDTASLARILSNAAKVAFKKYATTVVGIETNNNSKIKAAARETVNHKSQKLIVATCGSHSGNWLVLSMVEADFASNVRELVKAYKDPKIAELLKPFGGLAMHQLINHSSINSLN